LNDRLEKERGIGNLGRRKVAFRVNNELVRN
jgi:hypothetical protein